MTKRIISSAARQPAYEEWGRHLKLAHDLERVASGAGAMYLRRLTATLREIREGELARLATPHSALRTPHDGEHRSA